MSLPCNVCGVLAQWYIGTSRVPVCSEHHKEWLLLFNYKTLKELKVDIERIDSVIVPLLPTAEQTSIARFNALADQIREFRDATKQSFEDMNADFKALFDYVTRNQAMLGDDVRKALKRLNHAKPNVAVAKKKAAPLVGKKGTGRKG